MSLQEFIQKISSYPGKIDFQETIQFIDLNYNFEPTKFKNGDTINEENQNNGSCKVFSFALLNKLSEEQTLHLFGDYYRKDVLENPNGTDHQNIRNFIKYGWEGISFEGEVLSLR
jgi:hypothetical protein